ncbi:trypsin-like peptidase domain-containing protein [Synechococcus sp. Cruz-7E5]|nr:trypsin-like peptidase domain-containing protein [Synechococcus sp. Cruz-7E5]
MASFGSALLLMPASQQVPFGAALWICLPLLSQAPAQAQSAEAAAKVAQAVTVRIEGATQGSGVLVRRDGNRYTVLTAWHVVGGQRPGEELDIYTPDGKRHQLEQGSIKRLGEVDMAALTFSSSNSYQVAEVGDVRSVSMGSPIFVGGFPLPSSAVPTRLLRFLKGDVIANATVAIPDGYQLLYSNPTLPGMSGGAVLNAQGQLVGIHGKAEKADQITESSGKAVASGTNQAVPITYYRQYSTGAGVVPSTAQASTLIGGVHQADPLLAARAQPATTLAAWRISSDGVLELRTSPLAPNRNLPPLETFGVVRFGDNLVKLAQRYKVSIQDLVRLNPWVLAARLVEGEQIRVSGASALSISAPPISLQAFFEPGQGNTGPMVWVDLPGAPSRTRSIRGNGIVREVRIGKPDPKTTRLVIEFQPGTRLDPRRLRLVGTARDRWKLEFQGLPSGSLRPIGEGDMNASYMNVSYAP